MSEFFQHEFEILSSSEHNKNYLDEKIEFENVKSRIKSQIKKFNGKFFSVFKKVLKFLT